MGMSEPVYYTRDMVLAMPDDGNRYETVHGELLVSPSPRFWHQEIVFRLSRMLADYLDSLTDLHVVALPADISWGPDILVQPDVFVIPKSEARTLSWAEVKSLELAIEVLSPSTARYDRFTKRRLYQEVGIPSYWIVDAERHFVEVWTPEATRPTVEQERLVWQPEGRDVPLVIDLGELFRPI
jgi:Uma2 family endonuclease